MKFQDGIKTDKQGRREPAEWKVPAAVAATTLIGMHRFVSGEGLVINQRTEHEPIQ
jgi:hypothetical protein